MTIATAVLQRMSELRPSRSPSSPREVTVSRVIAAPVSVLRECCWDAARHGVVHSFGAARLSPATVRGTISIGPVRHDFRAAVAGGPGVLRWRSASSGGVIRFVVLDSERTRVEVTVTWTPHAAWAHAAAAAELDRREIAAALRRLAMIAESEAAEGRLGPIVV